MEIQHRKVTPFWLKPGNITMLAYHLELQRHLADCQSVLDLGCAGGSPIRYISLERAVGLELDEEYIAEAKKNGTHDEYIKGDVTKIRSLFKKNEFDACVALDLIEHVTKKEGIQLIADMAYVSRKKIIIFTPNGYMTQHNHEHPLQNHQSGWTADEMKKLGFEVYGMLGPKSLRTDQHIFKGNKYITGMISEVAQFTYIHGQPEKAAAIFCVKQL